MATSTAFTSSAEFEASYERLFKTFATNKTKSLKWRKWQLKQCWWMIVDNEEKIQDALKADLNRSLLESVMSDIVAVKGDILKYIEKLEEFTADIKPDAGVLFGMLSKARLRREPLGVSLIIGAWNYPFLLIIQPLIAAIASGCCVMLKPSELAVHTQDLVAEIIPKYLDNDAIRIVTGGPQETGRILDHKFNQIFYTGSPKVGRVVALAAAKHLTPVVLELGGQTPAIVTRHADVDLAAKRIANAKFMNAGQICLSVNHVFADPLIYEQFIDRMTYWNKQFHNNDNDSMVRIINERNYGRLSGMLEKTSGKVIAAAASNPETKYFAPTIVRDVTLDDSLLSEEIFGPIAPVISANLDEAIQSINSLPHPLGLYIFSNSSEEISHVLNSTQSGGVTVNDALLHAAVPDAPFGGVGESGHGSYHGQYGIAAFTHLRTVVEPPIWLDRFMGFRYPPFEARHVDKVGMKNKLGFKRGESIDDQKIGTKGRGWFWASALLVVGTGVAYQMYGAKRR